MKTTKLLALGLAATVAISSGTAMASEKGEKLFKKKCGVCHSIEPGKHKVGPSLAGVMGRKAGDTDFSKYKAMKGASFTWDAAKMDAWITNQKDFLKANKDIVGAQSTAMSAKIKKESERKEIIDFLSGAAD